MPQTTIHKQDARNHDLTLSFEDIEPWQTARYNGDMAWVKEKGQDVMAGMNAKHIKLVFTDETRDDVILHENLVNTYLAKKKTLWINFHDHLYAGANDA